MLKVIIDLIQKNKTMKKVSDLKEGDYIAFGFNYNGGTPKEIIVSNITSKHGDSFLVHFMYGHHSLGEYIKENEVLAIGNKESGKTKIIGWSGMYDCLQPEHPLIVKNSKTTK